MCEMMMKIFLTVAAILLCFSESCFSQNRIVVSKQKYELYVISSANDTLCVMPCALGKNYGQKKKKGDKKTPEGEFRIKEIQDSSEWTHDFKDGAGERMGAYGPWFLRLEGPNVTSIGIHGTCFPLSVGTRCTEGCIRVRNAEVVKLVKLVKVGCRVTILKDRVTNQL